MLLKLGLVNIPGSSPQSVALLEELLRKDYENQHCFTSESGLRNHLSHHLLAAHDLDLGAPASPLQAVYDNEVPSQKPLRSAMATCQAIDDSNWTLRLGKPE
ncbi:hypothetical protein C8R46DRAFT_1346501 [Mycena filopes]|nr:hypothetical protein C8R46DRAFT_1346501 [Mycena filopes]